jgi:integrase
MEALHLKPEDFDWEKRNTVTIKVQKRRKAKKEFSISRQPDRVFNVTEKYLKEVKRYVTKTRKFPHEYLFLENDELPENYESLDNKEKKKYYQKYQVAYHQMLKRKLRKAGIEDWRMFSLHNLRKTYGNWMRIFEIRLEDLIWRMGHDQKTFMTNYGSALVFTPDERREIMRILGEVK